MQPAQLPKQPPRLKTLLAKHSMPVGIASLSMGIICGALATQGNLDTRISYCDAITNPCQPVTIPAYRIDILKSAGRRVKLKMILPGQQLVKLGAGILGVIVGSVAPVAFILVLRQQETLEEQKTIEDAEASQLTNIAISERIAQAAIEAEARLKVHQKLTYDSAAEVYIEQSPELVQDYIEAQVLEEEQEAKLAALVEEEKASAGEDTRTTDVPPGKTAFERLQAIGNQAIDDLAYTSQSIIFLGIPGSGKSTSLGTLLGRMRQKYGDKLKLYALAMKNDSFGGAKVGQLNFNSDACWEILSEVITELRRRALMPSTKRKAYCEANPIKLILDDYVSQQRQFETVLKDKKVEYPGASGEVNWVKFGDAVDAVLSEITFNGRELCVSAIVSTQSGNLTDLPFLSSKSGRASVILMVQALKNTKKKQGNYEVVSQSINNAHLIADESERQRLRDIFSEAKELSFKHQQPIILTSNSDAGEYILGIVPNLLSEYEGYEQKYSENESTENETSPAKIVKNKPETTENKVNPDEGKEENKTDELLNLVYTYFKGKGKFKISETRSKCKALRTRTQDLADKDGKYDKVIRYLIEKLVERGQASIDEQDEFEII